MDLLLEGLLIVVLLALSAFFSSSETAFLSVSGLRMHSLLEKRVIGAESLYRLRQKRRKVIIALLIGNNIVTITLSAVATSLSIGLFGDEGLGIAIGAMSFIILTFGEIAPKSFATTYGEKQMLLVSPILEAYCIIVSPLVAVFEFINRLIPGVYSRPMGIEKFTEDEVRTAVKLGAQHNSISEREKELIENVLAFNDKTVGQVMTPKDRAVYFPADMKAAEAHEKAIKGTYSRFPVLREGKVVGTVSMRALGRAVLDNPNWRVGHVMWAPIKVKSSDKLNHAFSKLQTLGRHIAVVEGDHGEYLGLITIEDLMDELVGEHK